MSSKGFTLKSKKIQAAPPELREAPKASDESLNVKPSGITTSMKAMFAEKAPGPEASFSRVFAKTAPKLKTAQKPEPTPIPTPKVRAEPVERAPTRELRDALEMFDEELRVLGEGFLKEELTDPYVNDPPPAYVPENRRSFANFIKMNYDDFMLKPVGESIPVAPGDKYPYQKFIREYIRQASPYRGVLVYHGLGSGKTCTAIAASEALFATANKKIIVMTPFSLRKNFLKEVSFCGFRHFRLDNYWTPLDKEDPTHRMFAENILGLSTNYIRTAKYIWVPDFTQTEANYDMLTAEEQTEIRKQILAQLVYDKEKNPKGRIHFINYNGITKSKLKQMACEGSKEFDDAVIVVDEIHNLIRLMQGKLEKYIVPSAKPAVRAKQTYEMIGTGKWKPSLCESIKTYERGYMFYRLFLGAQRSKIIGLSGTPLINFPEELGILANILHGFLPSSTIRFQEVDDKAKNTITEVAMDNIFIDYVGIKTDAFGLSLTVTFLPPGVRKTKGGVERIPREEPSPTFEEIHELLRDSFQAAGLKIMPEKDLKAIPLLPEVGDAFHKNFLTTDGLALKNQIVLGKRLTGLVSYYKGSRQDLMPRVARDEVVRVPFSQYGQVEYSRVRTEEIVQELRKQTTPSAGLDVWGEAGDIGDTSQSASYKMGSRQKCNFAFPQSISRPTPRNKLEIAVEAPQEREIADTPPDVSVVEKDKYDFPEGEDDEEEEAIEEEEAEAEAEDETTEPIVEKPKARSLKELMAEKRAREAATAAVKDCKSERLLGEDYKSAILRAKDCLRADATKILGLSEGLKTHSSKYAVMLEKIMTAPGSSLVYSQFLDMEGIGIFRIAMETNGFAPIEIVNTATGPAFTAATEASFKKDMPRFMTFSGQEDENVRRMYLDIFNANFNELPARLKTVLQDAGYTHNHQGQIARVFCITSAGAEGLSLKNVRAVHIMEPYWNDVRLRQVKGRAIRIGSHLELPEDQRDVSIYTYISVFSEESQMAKEGEKKIDETIRNKDGITQKEARIFGVPIAPNLASYVLTSDERLFVISEKKKKVISELEKIMKSSAIDCQLNAPENQEVKCMILPLKEGVGDFLYHPNLDDDIRESASQFKVEKRTVIPIEYKKVKYFAVEGDRDASGAIMGFNLYPVEMKAQLESGEELPTPFGTTGAKDGKPAAPVIIS
jgi:hypothetical protein